MSKIFPLQGAVQNYAWGGDRFIPELLGRTLDGQPYAEYWLGAHAKAPATLQLSDGQQDLQSFIAQAPDQQLGQPTAERFGRLPFLFKVLDVKDTLSIQVHPSKQEAERGYERENQQGIPLDAKHRNYKDDNHKPEIMVALGEFWLLHGFLPEEQLLARLNNTPELRHLIAVFKDGNYRALYEKVMQEPAEETNRILKPLIDRIVPQYLAGQLDQSAPDYWAAKVAVAADQEAPLDKGIYSIYFFNIVRVEKGQAIFQDAGLPHAYLEGQNIELMANSDNVLRGGLTPKHVDVPELLQQVKFEATHPAILSGTLQKDGMERIYESPSPDFQLSRIELKDQQVYHATSASAEILFLLEGEVKITEASHTLLLKKGEAVFISAMADYVLASSSNTTIYKATTPLQSNE